MSKKQLAGIIVACTIAIIVVIFVVSTKGPTEPATPGTTPPTEELGGIKITASDLFDEYKENEIAADQRYKNRVLTTTGRIGKIGRDPDTNKPYISIGSGRYMGGGYSTAELLRCFFDREDQLLTVNRNEEVIVTGKCVGKRDNAIFLERCSLIEQAGFEILHHELKLWDRGGRGLEVTYKRFGYSFDYFLINPQGKVIEKYWPSSCETDYTCEDTEGIVCFELFRHGLPLPGEYKLVVKKKDTEKIIATHTFTFPPVTPPEIEITGYSGDFEVYWPPEGRQWRYHLRDIEFKVRNTSPYPIEITVRGGPISCAGQCLGGWISAGCLTDSFHCYDTSLIIFPDKEANCSSRAWYEVVPNPDPTIRLVWFYSPGIHEARIIFSGDFDITVPFQVVVPELPKK